MYPNCSSSFWFIISYPLCLNSLSAAIDFCWNDKVIAKWIVKTENRSLKKVKKTNSLYFGHICM